jgi:hypothetical protein
MDLESFRRIYIFETNEILMFLDTFPDRFRTGKRNDYLDEDIPDEDDTISRGGALAQCRGFGTCGWKGVGTPRRRPTARGIHCRNDTGSPCMG